MFRLRFDYLQGFLFFKTPIYLVLVWMIARITGVAGVRLVKPLIYLAGVRLLHSLIYLAGVQLSNPLVYCTGRPLGSPARWGSTLKSLGILHAEWL